MEFESLNGYTHIIRYEKFVKTLDVFAQSHFRTTEDAVDKHVKTLSKNPDVKNIVVEKI